jgi:hypothetical protein
MATKAPAHAEEHSDHAHAHVDGDDLPHHGKLSAEPRSPTWLPVAGLIFFAGLLVWWLSTPTDDQEAAARAAASASASGSVSANPSAEAEKAAQPAQTATASARPAQVRVPNPAAPLPSNIQRARPTLSVMPGGSIVPGGPGRPMPLGKP